MRKVDYNYLSQIIKNRREFCIDITTGKPYSTDYQCALNQIEYLAIQCASHLNVNKDEFLKACGIV